MTAAVKKSGLTPSNFAIGFILACLAVYICHIAADIMIPFVVAVFIWYLINALARFLGMFRFEGNVAIPRAWRVFLAIVILTGMVFIIFRMVHANIDEVGSAAPRFQESFEKIIAQSASLLHLRHVPTLHEITNDVIKKYVDIGQVMTSFTAMLTDLAGKTLVILFFVGFLLYEQRFFNRKLKWMFPDRRKEEKIRAILTTIDTKIQKYIGVKAFVSFLDSFLTFTILSFFNVDFAGFWGVMAFFLHFIPYAGSFVAISMPVLITFIQFGDLGMFVKVLTALCISHAFLGHILDPYLMGNNLNLSPIFIITNLALWGMVWGVPGMFLAIPILAIATLTLEQFNSTRPIAIMLSKTGVINNGKEKQD